MGKRGGRAVRPARSDEWTLRYLNQDVAKGWETLCTQQAGSITTLYDRLTANPTAVDNRDKQGRLKGELSVVTVKGDSLDQWQYELSGGARVWYAVDPTTLTVWIALAPPRHPNQTK